MVGYQTVHPKATQEYLVSTFAALLKTKGSNAFSLIMQRDWEEVLTLLAQMRLKSILSIYEGWADSAAQELGISTESKRKTWSRFVQPMIGTNSIAPVASLLGHSYLPMREVASACKASKLSMPSRLRDLGTCFRAYKEL